MEVVMLPPPAIAGGIGFVSTLWMVAGASGAPAEFKLTESTTISFALFLSGIGLTVFLVWRAACWWTEVKILRRDLDATKSQIVDIRAELDVLRSRFRRIAPDIRERRDS